MIWYKEKKRNKEPSLLFTRQSHGLSILHDMEEPVINDAGLQRPIA